MVNKLLLILIPLPFLIACPRSRVHTDWQDSTLTKKEYLKREVKQAEDIKAYEEVLIKLLKNLIGPEW